MYKVLDGNGHSCHGGDAEWSLPMRQDDGTWTPGEWMPPVTGELETCRNGYHMVSIMQLLSWLGEKIFEVEVGEEEVVHDDDKSVVRTCRLIRECTGWNERTARLFACDCAERVLPLFEAEHPDDDRPRQAIEVARRYANGDATDDELRAARYATLAAWDAAQASAGAAILAARYTARDAARDATRAAQYAALTARASVGAARDAAWDAAWDAARDATRDATLATQYAALAARTSERDARDAERQWQAARLKEILEV